MRAGHRAARISPACCSISVLTGENTDEIAIVRMPCAAISAPMRRSSSGRAARSRGRRTRSRHARVEPGAERFAQVVGPIDHRRQRLGRRQAEPHGRGSGASRRCTTALVKCVVPIITTSTVSAAMPEVASTSESAAATPLITSGVVAAFTPATTTSPSISTASVLVPPTSMPMRITRAARSGCRDDRAETPSARTPPALPACA